MTRVVVTSIFHYIVWFVCVLSAARGHLYIGFLFSCFVTMLLTFFFCSINNLKILLIFIFILSFMGFVADTVFCYFGLIGFESASFSYPLAPLWLLGVWINFSCFVFFVARDYFNRYVPVAACAFFGFPAAYYFGATLGAAEIFGKMLYFAVGVVWSILLPSFFIVFNKLFKVA